MILGALATTKKVLIFSMMEIVRTIDLSVFLMSFIWDEIRTRDPRLGKPMLYR